MELGENGASLISWDNEELFWLLDALRLPDESGHQLDDNDIYVCQIPKSTLFSLAITFSNPSSHFRKSDTPIPDTLRLWRTNKDYYMLRSKTPMTLDSEALLSCIKWPNHS